MTAKFSGGPYNPASVDARKEEKTQDGVDIPFRSFYCDGVRRVLKFLRSYNLDA